MANERQFNREKVVVTLVSRLVDRLGIRDTISPPSVDVRTGETTMRTSYGAVIRFSEIDDFDELIERVWQAYEAAIFG